ncbi:hypothetical protein UFOVP1007_23 [uncultured Caudovirales phage]|uniref:Uncharacterized protein n=1 Tax=uncultured Caudovirales phage TaxID=2100421 RepID=A0A6J5QEI2_9CAUD|nr:hypothetical protein UFOVP927_40 [uncultured Caudovirales phage]CAB4178104.1 hypothetical protein UFOVP1007_23 [uncultured Caudovirales phage]CAB4187368.1 hypothetical protein UFOVP1159_23 [uncultured Caudovirales phage]
MPTVSSAFTYSPVARPTVLISTQTASSSASIEFTRLSGYDKYFLVFSNLIPTAAGSLLNFYVGTGYVPTYLTSDYNFQYFSQDVNNATSFSSGGAGSEAPITGNLTALKGGSNGRVNGNIDISGMINGTDACAHWVAQFGGSASTANTASARGSSLLASGNTTVKTALKLQFSATTILSGKVSLYGLSQ